MRKLIGRLMVAAIAGWSGAVNATLIVDTGTPTESGWALQDLQYFAGRFDISSAHAINMVEGYFSNDSRTIPRAGVIAFNLHTVGSNIPGTILYSSELSVDAETPMGWYGIADLNWLLDAGTYWLSLIPDSDFAGAMDKLAPNPMEHYAASLNGNWREGELGTYDFVTVGMRIDATPYDGQIPTPATLALFGLGLAGLGWSRRKKV